MKNILKSIILTGLTVVFLTNQLSASEELVVHGISKTQLDSLKNIESKNIQSYQFNLQTALEKQGYFLCRVEHHKNNLYVDLGKITKIEIKGVESLNKELLMRYVSSLKSAELTLKKVDSVLTLVNSIAGISATFSFQRENNGTYTLFVLADEIKQNGSVSLDNIPTRLGNRTRVSVNQNIYSLISSGDLIRMRVSHVGGDNLASQTGFSISYQDQLEFNGGYWEVTYGDNESKTNLYSPITGTTQNDYNGQYGTISFAHPIILQHNHESFLITQYEYSEEKTDNIGDVKLNVFRFSYFDLYHGNNGDSLSLGVTLSHGKNLEHYNTNEEISFNHLRVGGGYITPLGKSNLTEFRIETYAQIGSKDVVGSELFYLGSESFLRGYKSGYFVGESGLAGSFELAHSYNRPIEGISRLSAYIFTDYGIVFNDDVNINNSSRENKQEAYSIGLGTKIYLQNNLYIDTYIAKPLTDDYYKEDINPSVYAFLQYSW